MSNTNGYVTPKIVANDAYMSPQCPINLASCILPSLSTTAFYSFVPSCQIMTFNNQPNYIRQSTPPSSDGWITIVLIVVISVVFAIAIIGGIGIFVFSGAKVVTIPADQPQYAATSSGPSGSEQQPLMVGERV